MAQSMLKKAAFTRPLSPRIHMFSWRLPEMMAIAIFFELIAVVIACHRLDKFLKDEEGLCPEKEEAPLSLNQIFIAGRYSPPQPGCPPLQRH